MTSPGSQNKWKFLILQYSSESLKVCQIYVERLYKQGFIFLKCLLFHIIIIISTQHEKKGFQKHPIYNKYVLPSQENHKAAFQQKSRKRKVNIFFLKRLLLFYLRSFFAMKENRLTQGGGKLFSL